MRSPAPRRQPLPHFFFLLSCTHRGQNLRRERHSISPLQMSASTQEAQTLPPSETAPEERPTNSAQLSRLQKSPKQVALSSIAVFKSISKTAFRHESPLD